MRVRLPRVRVRLWWVMVAVALVGLASGAIIEIGRRRDRYTASCYRHFFQAEWSGMPASQRSPERLRYEAYHRVLSRKYAQAARYPWLPVAPDPPPPPHPPD